MYVVLQKGEGRQRSTVAILPPPAFVWRFSGDKLAIVRALLAFGYPQHIVRRVTIAELWEREGRHQCRHSRALGVRKPLFTHFFRFWFTRIESRNQGGLSQLHLDVKI